MMGILVTGAAGLLGTHLCEYLLSQKIPVIGIDNYITGSYQNISLLSQHSNFIFIESNVENPNLETLLAKFDIEQIFHLAEPTGVKNLTTFSEEMLSTSSVGTKNILDIALAHKAKFLFSSSSEVYGQPLVFPQSEDYTGNVNTFNIRAPYEEGKRFSETLVSTYVKKHHIDAKVVRIFNTFGLYHPHKDFPVISKFLHAALKNEDLTIFGNGMQNRTFLYVDDLIKAFIMVMAKSPSGEVYNVGSEIQTSIENLAHIIINLTNSSSKLVFEEKLPYDHEGRRPCLKKIHRLGWKSTVSLEMGIKKVIKFLQQSG